MEAVANGVASPIDYALQYRAAGLSPLPVKVNGTKAPDLSSWAEFQERIATEDECRSWYGRKLAGVGIIHGKVSGTEVVDLDNAEVGTAYLNLLAKVDHDLYRKVTIIQTPRPGYHVVFRSDDVEGNQKLAQKIDADTGKLVTLIETRGEGGFTVAPGSPPECHETGRTYEHILGPPLTEIQTITAEERQTLLSLARSFHEVPFEEPRELQHERPAYDGLTPGDAYDQRTSWEQILEPVGWLKLFSRADVDYWRRPGKDGVGWSATTGNKSKAGRSLLCVFSTSADPFEGATINRACSSHSKFDAYARLHHGGNHSAAAKQLAAEGYGDKPRPGMPDLTGDRYGDVMDVKPKYEPNPNEIPRPRFAMKWMNSAELAAGDFGIDYFIEGVLAKHQSCIMAGPMKGGKTSIAVELAISLATGTPFLGSRPVAQAVPVGMLLGEGGFNELQERANRTAKAHGWELADIGDRLVWSDTLPKLIRPEHLEALEEFLRATEPEVIIIDPAYLCVDGADAEKYFAIGEQLQSLSDLCKRVGVTWILATHTKKNTLAQHEPLTLSDIAWSGFGEYARQWLLINRRERYEEGSGEHRLWLSVGGSAGHSDLWAIDIAEGTRKTLGGRFWEVQARYASEVQHEARDAAEQRRDERAAAKLAKEVEHDKKAVIEAMQKLKRPEVQSQIAAAARIPNKRAQAAIVDLESEGHIRAAEVVRSNNQKYAGYELATNG